MAGGAMRLIEFRGRRLAMGGGGEEESQHDKRWGFHERLRTGMETSFSLGDCSAAG
jgi:hypothetical protein